MDTVVSMMDISPSQAEKWLDSIPEYQRKIDDKQVKKLVMAINKGQWRENGATIVFNAKGELLDGQHRLKASILSGKPIRSLVVKGVSEEESTFQTIGDEKPRKIADFMKCPNVNVVSSVARMYWQLTIGQWPIGHGGEVPPIADVLRLAKKWESKIVPLVGPLSEAGRFLGQYSYCVFLVFYHVHVRPVGDTARVTEFFCRVADGLGLTATDPVYKLRQRFLNVGATGKIQRTSAQALILKALYLYLDRKPCSLLRYEPDREDFPALRGYRK